MILEYTFNSALFGTNAWNSHETWWVWLIGLKITGAGLKFPHYLGSQLYKLNASLWLHTFSKIKISIYLSLPAMYLSICHYRLRTSMLWQMSTVRVTCWACVANKLKDTPRPVHSITMVHVYGQFYFICEWTQWYTDITKFQTASMLISIDLSYCTPTG